MPTQEDIVIRDNLIAAQETLLNVYRCRFGVDTHAVPGGCANGLPAQGLSQPGTFQGTPTWVDIAVRDQLIAVQESLLNTYRCRFDFETDTHLTLEGCPGQSGPPDNGQSGSLTFGTMLAAEDVEGEPPPGLITPKGVSVAVLGSMRGNLS